MTIAVAGMAACARGPQPLPSPRPLIVPSGARLTADTATLRGVNDWVIEADRTIEEDPTFYIVSRRIPAPAYPWETLAISATADTAEIAYDIGLEPDFLSFQIYAFLHLMSARNQLVDWFPEADGLSGFDLERLILEKTAESWLLGRTVYDTRPYAVLDEIIYTADAGYLDEMILTARPEDFPEEKAAFEAANPGRLEAYAAWFEETFEREPPGLRERGLRRRGGG